MSAFIRKTAWVLLPCLLASSGCVAIDGVECREDQECSDSVFCNGEEQCRDGVCVAGVIPCGPTPCPCVEEIDSCRDCCDDADCDDGIFCNGEELCAESGCADGTPPCGCDCVEERDECGECCHDADCDDGVFCNGAETCFDFNCVAGDPPCARGGLTCDGNCMEDSDECISPCATDADCDDGQFCNGLEMCDLCGLCQPSQAPCDEFGPPGCPGLCLEEGDVCTDPCTDDLDCDDELFCNGDESCDQCGFCSLGVSPCDANECDELNDVCLDNP